MENYKSLLLANKAWVKEKLTLEDDYFENLSKGQQPTFLWVGCSDSRVPAEEVTGTAPGEIFVHRNIANLIVPDDLNVQSVLHYAIEVLKVKHVIVCGHYGCGGVQASLERRKVGLVDNWLRHVRDVHHKHAIVVESVLGPAKLDTLCELNVIEQAANVCHSTVMQDAWARGQKVEVHAWIYGLRDGLIKDLGLNVSSLEALTPAYGKVLAHYRRLGGIAG